MTRVFNDVATFADDVVAGLVGAYPQYVQPVFGGVLRSTEVPAGQVAVVIGGGSGHYPAFSGWVGPGLAHAAVQGNVFASPSASQVYSVCRAAHRGGGILLGFGNYAGDLLNFGQAAARLRTEGLDVRILPVTDDIASGPPDEPHLRRGTCGDLVVFKVAAAAAERGWTLDDVERVATKANARVRSLGIAFGGCTLPGASEPLFSVAPDEMSVGLGVHGEPGIRELPMGTAAEIADLLVDAVLAEAPARGSGGYEGRAAVLLNGLGTVKYEELFTVYGRVAQRLEQAGIIAVLPEVGELMSSLDMAGLSLTICYLDEELESLWGDPVDTVSFRRGGLAPRPLRGREAADLVAAQKPELGLGSADSRAAATAVADVLRAMNRCAIAHEEELGRMDATAGDGDHGRGMVLGSAGAVRAAESALQAGVGVRSLLSVAGEQWAESAGGTSGALWGAGLMSFAGQLSDSTGISTQTVVSGVRAFVSTVVELGGAELGDKTMVDALLPFATALEASVAGGNGLEAAWSEAVSAATSAAAATAETAARRGRSRVLGAKSIGTPDPGATSFALLMGAVAESAACDAWTAGG